MIDFRAFVDEAEKIASAGHALVDIAGLGVLGAPSVQKLRGKPMSSEKASKYEVAGLGTLAAGVAHEHRHAFADVFKSGTKTLAKHAQRMDKDMRGQALNDAFKHAPASPAPASPVSKPTPFDQMVRSHDLQPHAGPTGPVHSGLELARPPRAGGTRGMIARAARAVR